MAAGGEVRWYVGALVSGNAYNYFASLTSKAEKAVPGLLGDLTLAGSLRDLYDMDRESGRQA